MIGLLPAAHHPITVALVDDQWLLREGLRTLLELHADIRVVGEAGDGIEAVGLIERLQPRVVLMDLRMPRRDGVETTREVTSRWPNVQVLVLTTFDDDDLVFAALGAGAAGYLLKDVGSDALAEAIRAASRGESPLQPRIASKVVGRFRDRGIGILDVGHETEPLTPRETDILRLLGTGATNREIAGRLGLSDGTVKNYISAILAKTGLRDRTQAAVYAIQHGL